MSSNSSTPCPPCPNCGEILYGYTPSAMEDKRRVASKLGISMTICCRRCNNTTSMRKPARLTFRQPFNRSQP